MYDLPEPPAAPAAGQATNPLTESVIQAAVRDLVHQTSYDNPDLPSHKDGPRIGDTPPVPQPDSRIVPQWATGIAVASIGVGAGATGIGCAAWLFFKGLSMASVPSLERFAWIVIAPFAGAAMVLTAIGGVISKVRRVNTTTNNTYNGTVHQKNTTTNSKNVGVWAKNTNPQ